MPIWKRESAVQLSRVSWTTLSIGAAHKLSFVPDVPRKGALYWLLVVNLLQNPNVPGSPLPAECEEAAGRGLLPPPFPPVRDPLFPGDPRSQFMRRGPPFPPPPPGNIYTAPRDYFPTRDFPGPPLPPFPGRLFNSPAYDSLSGLFTPSLVPVAVIHTNQSPRGKEGFVQPTGHSPASKGARAPSTLFKICDHVWLFVELTELP